MKKNTTLVIVAVVALAVGYLLGTNLGAGDSSLTKGDINAVNAYHQLLISPDNMAFDNSMAGNEDAVSQTISTLQIMESRITDFVTLAGIANAISVDDSDVASCTKQIEKAVKDGQKAKAQAKDALEAAIQLKAGQKADLKKAQKNAEAAFAFLGTQLTIGKQYVEAVDKYLQGKDLVENVMLASLRDLVVSHCAVNATLTQDESEMDYWCNISGKVKSEDMAISIE